MSDKTYRESFSLKTDDIPGAKPVLKSYRFINKINYSNSTVGIDKSCPKFLFISPPKPANIDTRPIPVQKSIKNSLDVRDINVVKSKLTNVSSRDSLDVSDISKKAFYSPQYNRPNLKKRITNPLTPEYLVINESNQSMTIGEIPGSKPKTLINTAKPPHNRTLDVKDIQGNTLKYSSTLTSFLTPKAKLKDLISHLCPSVQFKSLSGHTSPGKSIDTSLSSVGMSLKSSPNGTIRTVVEEKGSKNRIKKKMPLPRSPRK